MKFITRQFCHQLEFFFLKHCHSSYEKIRGDFDRLQIVAQEQDYPLAIGLHSCKIEIVAMQGYTQRSAVSLIKIKFNYSSKRETILFDSRDNT